MRSEICPYIPGEEPMERHGRRLRTAVDYEALVRVWAVNHGGTLKVNNGNHHWQLRIGNLFVEWWPSSGKCVRDQKWHKPVKLHDAYQLMRQVDKWLSRDKTSGRKSTNKEQENGSD